MNRPWECDLDLRGQGEQSGRTGERRHEIDDAQDLTQRHCLQRQHERAPAGAGRRATGDIRNFRLPSGANSVSSPPQKPKDEPAYSMYFDPASIRHAECVAKAKSCCPSEHYRGGQRRGRADQRGNGADRDLSVRFLRRPKSFPTERSVISLQNADEDFLYGGGCDRQRTLERSSHINPG